MDASKVFFTGTVQDVKVTDSGTLFIKIETLIHETLPPLKYVVKVKREIADSIRVQPGDLQRAPETRGSGSGNAMRIQAPQSVARCTFGRHD